MRIRAAVTRSKGAPMSIENVELDDPRPDEVLVRLAATGICHADLFIRDQVYPVQPPVVLGHEGAGIVEGVGTAVRHVSVGDHVVISYNYCRICPSCIDGQPNYCHDFYAHNFACERADGTTAIVDGNGNAVRSNFFGQSSFATYAVCPEQAVVRVRQDAPFEVIAPMACGVQTGAGAVIHAFGVRAGQSIAVFGAGSVGMSAVMAAQLVGASTVVAVDLVTARLDLALTLGATHVLNGHDADVAETIRQICGGVDFALDTTGSPSVIRSAVDSLAPRGTCGTVGGNAPDTEIHLNLIDMMASGRTFRGIVEGDANPPAFIPQLIELYMRGRFPIDKIITTYPFDEINTAIADTETGVTIKPVLLHSLK